MTARKSGKKCTVCWDFLVYLFNLMLFYFLVSVADVVAWSLLVVLPCNTILDMRQFCLIWLKTRDKIDICSNPYRKQHFLLSYLKTLSVGPTGVWTHGLLLSSTSSSNWAKQVKEKLKQGCHQGSNPGPWAPKAMQPTVPSLHSSNHWSLC